MEADSVKVFGVIMKIVIALAAVAGAVYLAATYGDRLVAWARKLLGGCRCCGGDVCCCDEDCCCDDVDIAVEIPTDAPAAEASTTEANAAVASDADFEG